MLEVAAAIITASGGVIQKLIEIAGKSEPNARAKKTADKTYDRLAQHITTHSVRVLRALRQKVPTKAPGEFYASLTLWRNARSLTGKISRQT
jgi:hypothetical protein